MKIILPFRASIIAFAIGLICSIPSISVAQCNSCPSSSQTVSACLSGINGTAVYDLGDLDAFATIPSGGSVEYYEGCMGNSGNLNGEVASNTATYEFEHGDEIFVHVLDDMGMCDSIFRVTLNITGNSCDSQTIDLDGWCASGGNGTFVLTDITEPSGTTHTYYDDCGSSASEITSPYTGGHNDIIYVEEKNNSTGCVAIIEVTLKVVDFVVEIDIDPPNGLFCDGESVGLAANVTGGTGSTSYAWTTGETTQSFNSTTTGDYEVTVTRNGCAIVSNEVSVQDVSFSVSVDETPASCFEGNDGQAIVTINGATGSYLVEFEGETNRTGGSTQTYNGLVAGTYDITVTNASGRSCSITTSATIGEPSSAPTLSLTANDATMVGGDGSIDVVREAGTADYVWIAIGPETKNATSGSASFTIPGLTPGTYDVTVTDDDGNGCAAIGSVTIDPVSCALSASVASTEPPTCHDGVNDGSITITTTNFASPYRIDYTGAKAGSKTAITSGTTTISNLNIGSYTLTITDNEGCIFPLSGEVENQDEITFSVSEESPACFNTDEGEVQISNITNGIGPYRIKLNPSGSGSTITTPALSSTSRVISNVPPATYQVSVLDVNDCESDTRSVVVDESDPVVVTIEGKRIFCFDDGSGSINTTQAFSDYKWSTGPGDDGDRTITIPNPNGSNTRYDVTVTNAAGCEGTNFLIAESLPDLSVSLITTSSKTSVRCASECDGRIDINVQGGTGSYTYNWTGPNSPTTNESITGLCPGTYNLTITDGNMCTVEFEQVITVPDPISISTSAADANCKGDSNGGITTVVTGGTSPYTYLWSSGNVTTSSISNIPAGAYTITVTDDNGCFNTESATVNEPPAVNGIITPGSAEICNNESILLSVSGGSGSNAYSWEGSLGSNDAITVSPTTTTNYEVTVTDEATNNCTDVVSVTVTVNQLPTANIDVSETSGITNDDSRICEGEPVTITARGGVSYNWAGGVSNPFTVTPSSGMETYAVTVTDGNGCTDATTVDIDIFENPTPIIDFSRASQVVQDLQIITSNSIANCESLVNCEWTIDGSPGGNGDCDGISPTFTTQGAKQIRLTVENSCGCSESVIDVLEIFASDQCAVEQFTVNNGVGTACVGDPLDIVVKDRPTPNCNITTNSFEVFRDGARLDPDLDYVYTIDKVTFNTPGTYEMRRTIGDNCGCTRPSTRSIEIVPSPSISFAAGNILSGCEDDELRINFDGFDVGEKVRVQYSDGNIFTYEEDNFNLTLDAEASQTLTILSVQNSTCEVPVSGQVLNINVTPKFELVSFENSCADDGLSYTLTIRTRGGDPDVSIIADGIVGTTSGANNFIITERDPSQEYNFTLMRGDLCGPIEVTIPAFECNCTFVTGKNTELNGFFGCEDEVFDISNIFSTDSSEFNPETDTLIYVLHNRATGLSLGTVFRILPSSTAFLDNNFEGFIPDYQFYKLSVVGLRKDALPDFDLDKPESLSNAGANRCLSVRSGIPVIWNKAPEPQLGTVGDNMVICRNAYDFMIFAKDRQEGSSITFSIEGLEDEDISSYGFADTAFVHFVDNGQDSFNITIRESKEYFAGGQTLVCEGETVTTVYVKEGPGAPPLSEVVLWPGNILASTADPLTTCFEWGFFNFGQQSGILGTEKFFFAPTDIDFKLTNRVYFVDTYFCENPECVTRVFYNADGPTPGLNYKEEKTYSYLIKPNPNQGHFTLDLFSDKKGEFDLNVIDITGKVVVSKRSRIDVGSNSEEFDLGAVPKGIYFIQIMNRDLKEYSIDKIVIN